VCEKRKRVMTGGGLIEWGEEDMGLYLRVKWSLAILSEKLAKLWSRVEDKLGKVDGSRRD
jgi:hypothetical protein